MILRRGLATALAPVVLTAVTALAAAQPDKFLHVESTAALLIEHLKSNR